MQYYQRSSSSQLESTYGKLVAELHVIAWRIGPRLNPTQHNNAVATWNLERLAAMHFG